MCNELRKEILTNIVKRRRLKLTLHDCSAITPPLKGRQAITTSGTFTQTVTHQPTTTLELFFTKISAHPPIRCLISTHLRLLSARLQAMKTAPDVLLFQTSSQISHRHPPSLGLRLSFDSRQITIRFS